MYKILFIGVFFLLIADANALTVSQKDAHIIAEKIWKNECGGTVKGLTSWNAGENFASLGIGHFIWFPEGKKERFQETFPALLTFLESKQVAFPDWLKQSKGCPWNSREAFYQEIDTPQMNALRSFLLETKDWQAIFIAQRLENILPSILDTLPANEKNRVKLNFYRLANTPNGLYALIDYLNFKGAGISKEESYHNQGWGLTQLLQRLNPEAKDLVQEFVIQAKQLLEQRVQNAPPERNEQRWLKGWHNRLDTYLK